MKSFSVFWEFIELMNIILNVRNLGKLNTKFFGGNFEKLIKVIGIILD